VSGVDLVFAVGALLLVGGGLWAYALMCVNDDQRRYQGWIRSRQRVLKSLDAPPPPLQAALGIDDLVCWKLQRAGVSTLEQLAASDERVLARRAGLGRGQTRTLVQRARRRLAQNARP